MAERQETAINALAAAGTAFGVLAALAPSALAGIYGLPRDGAFRWALRGWGTRTAALGALGLTARGESRRAVLRAVAGLSVADVMIAAVAGDGLPPRSRLQAAATSGVFATAAALLALGD